MVSSSEVRILPERFSPEKFPPMARQLKLEGISPITEPVWTADFLHAIEKLIVYRKMTFEIIEVLENGALRVCSDKLNASLQRFLFDLNRFKRDENSFFISFSAVNLPVDTLVV